MNVTAEELHFLAAEAGLESVPGLGPLPLDPADQASMRLMVGTADRSLHAREEEAREAMAVLRELSGAGWTVSADSSVGGRAWWPVDGRVAQLSRTSPTDYSLELVDDLRASLVSFLRLDGSDEDVGEPEFADEERVASLGSTVYCAVVLADAGSRAEGIALEWVDPGSGPVWVVEPIEGEVTVSRTGRAAVLKQLLAAH